MAEIIAVASELDYLLAEFSQAVTSTAQDKNKFAFLCKILQETNSEYIKKDYSDEPEANVLANVVAAYYAPLMHAFSLSVLKNISCGILPPTIVAPPRDAIPLATSLEALTIALGLDPVVIIKPPVTRKTAGIANNQSSEIATKDALFDLMLEQYFAGCGQEGVTELETGIYSTTSMVMAEKLKQLGMNRYAAVKFYGLGPNLSFVHALLSEGKEWIAEKAEAEGLVDMAMIGDLMVLVDSMEELGMQNMHQSIGELAIDQWGSVYPVIDPVDAKQQEIARATNAAIADTATQYVNLDPITAKTLLLKTVTLMSVCQSESLPIMLTKPIPSMDNKDKHFQNIRESQLLDYPQLLL